MVKNVDKPIESIADDMNLFVNQGDDLKRCGNKLLGQIHNVCTSAMNIMDFGLLEKAVEKVKSARTIYLAGVGTSSVVAQSLYIKFNTVGLKVQYTLDAHINLTSMLVGDKNDVLIAFSYSGTTTIMNKILEAARLKGIFIIGICGNLDSKFAKTADIVLQSPAMEQQARIGAVSSLYSQQFVGDMLFLGYITKAYEKTKQAVSLNNEIRNGLHKE
jgi:DNA-binding MurR/RpiR family transcriptional regulator